VRERVKAAGYHQLEPKPVDLERLSRVILSLVADAREPELAAEALSAAAAGS
jgi:hypothetical protein